MTRVLLTFFIFLHGGKYFPLKYPSSSMEDERLFYIFLFLPWKTGVFSLFTPIPPWRKPPSPFGFLVSGGAARLAFYAFVIEPLQLMVMGYSFLPDRQDNRLDFPLRSIMEIACTKDYKSTGRPSYDGLVLFQDFSFIFQSLRFLRMARGARRHFP